MNTPVPRHTPGRPHPARRQGFSLIEMLVSLAIVSVLLTATVVALDASFYAYASAAESASTHTSARMISHRLLTLVRTSTAHGPLDDAVPTDSDWTAMIAALNTALVADGKSPVTIPTPQAAAGQGPIPRVFESSFLRLIDQAGNDVVVIYLGDPWATAQASQDDEELWVVSQARDDPTDIVAQPLIGGVTRARFTTRKRLDESGVPVLERGSMIVEIAPSRDTSFAIESQANTPPMQVIASTAPRKLLPR